MTLANTQSSCYARSLIFHLCITACAACYSPQHAVDETRPASATLDLTPFQRDSATAGRLGTQTPADCQSETGLTALELSVRTTNAGGRYAPRNVGAFWIETADGRFVKTLARWGTRRAKWLTRFQGSAKGDVTDAVTGATLAAHKTHEVRWDLNGLDGCEVETGDYALLLELTDRDAAGQSMSIAFSKQDVGFVLSPADTQSFHDVRLTLR